MKAEDRNIEPSTNLSLALGYSNQCIQRILNNDPGAGANAASEVDKTFMVTTPLSELVWSPHKGLRLRCADGGFSDKNPPLSRPGAEPMSETGLELKTATGDQMEEAKIEREMSVLHEDDLGNNKGKETDEANMETAQNNPTCEESIVRDTDVRDGNPGLLGMEIVLAPEMHDGLKECQAYDTKEVRNARSFGNQNDESPLIREKDRKNKLVTSPQALSDVDATERMLNKEDDSHESVESCNSAGLFSTGKRQQNSDQRFTVGIKRARRKIQESPGSSLLVKQDGSFVNWISNMTTGFLKSCKGQEPSLSPLPVDLNHEHENHDQGDFTCTREEDQTCRTKGFQSNFCSLYSQEEKEQKAVTLNTDHQTEGSKQCEQDNRMCELNATPIACRMVTGNVYKWFLPSIEGFNGLISGNQLSANFLAIGENNKSNSTEDKNLCNLASGKETSFTSSRDKQKNNSDFPSDEKTTPNFVYNIESLESSWIARFAPRTSGPLLKQYPSGKSSGEVFNCSADGMNLKRQLTNLLGYSSERENVKAKNQSTEELLCVQCCGAATEASSGLYKAKGHHDDDSTYKLKPILSPSVKTSEAMAFVFARRLEALKHITTSNNPDSSASANMMCFFCGIKGHHLRQCPDVADTELEGVLRNQAENYASLISQSGPSKVQLDVRSEDDEKLKDITAITPTVGYRNDSGMEKDMNNWKSKETATSEKTKLNVKLSNNGSKENQAAPFYSFISGLISDVPKGIFDIVRSLRLTRPNILRWMTSNVPISPLDGYFVRLRLGKWEEGLGGTGYYVARITGMQTDRSLKNSKKSIAVNVGGIKCLVESQSVSNHDFLEDELRTWWSAASKDGGDGKLPSKEELRLKVKEKKTMGF